MCEISPPTQPVWNKASGDHNGKKLYNSSIKGDWTYFSSN